MSVNEQLLNCINGRKGSQCQFGYGITTASQYVKQFAEHCGDVDSLARSVGGMSNLAHAVKESENMLVYANPDMVIEAKATSSAFDEVLPKDSDIEVPKNTLMLLRHVVTTPSVDRDNDILRTEGATVDPKMVLLWQHMPLFPIGKRLLTVEHTKDTLRMVTALVDINDLTNDIAKMVEADILRFSHGFRALEFNERKVSDGQSPGFEITKYEIMEASLVSVPSNKDAEMEAFARVKAVSGVMKEYIAQLAKGQMQQLVRGHRIDEPEAQEQTKVVESTNEKVYAEMPGSFESIRQQLQMGIEAHLEAAGIDVQGDRGYAYIEATFSDHAIIQYWGESGSDQVYYKSGWRTEDGKAMWSGEPTEITIEATIREKMASEILLIASPIGEKAGKVLSKKNEAKLRDAVEDMKAASNVDDVPRAAKSLINGAKKKVSEVVAVAGGSSDDEGKNQGTVEIREVCEQDVLQYFLDGSARTVCETLVKVKAITQVHDTNERVNQMEEMLS